MRIEIHADRVTFGGRFSLGFQRTLRIPEDGEEYPLPPGLGEFPLYQVEDYRDRLPTELRQRGGCFFFMYQREALWLGFESAWWKPNAVQIGVGRVNAITGGEWETGLHDDPQDYLVCPPQPWLDGIHVDPCIVRQFVARPLGQGHTIENHLTGREEYGGIQIRVYEPRPGRFPEARPPSSPNNSAVEQVQLTALGLDAGGKIKQKIYPDPYGLGIWDTTNPGTLWIHILNSQLYQELTGLHPPPSPISAETYTQLGYPWYKLYDEYLSDVPVPDITKSIEGCPDSYGDREPET